MGTYVSQALVFFQTMVSYIQQNSTVLTDFRTGSLLNVLLNAVAVVNDAVNAAIFNAQQQAYLSTATGQWLDSKAADYGITRKPAVAASGNFNFAKNVAAVTNIDIPAGSLVTTVPAPNTTTLQFQTTADATLLAGTTSISVPVVCTTAGSAGNIPAGTQLLIASAITGIDGVNISVGLSNGVDVESDDALRARAQQSFKGLAIGTSTWYQTQALSVSGVVSASVVNGYTVPNGVGVYITGPNNTIPSESIISQVQTVLNNSVPQIDKPFVLSPTQLTVDVGLSITVIAGNDPTAATTAVQNAVSSYINGLGLGAQKTQGWIYPSQIITSATGQTGVADAGSVTLNGGTAPIPVNLSQLPYCTSSDVTVSVVTP